MVPFHARFSWAELSTLQRLIMQCSAAREMIFVGQHAKPARIVVQWLIFVEVTPIAHD
ncbi:hypothetical protein SAMN05444169_6287 [Bradyrhizobium erythrophlei]|uniref:Uncharacterized protein n=1 Tax=Bradyrhizobium erythrophlei TaxID=1437360 RepID=A0A1M5R274_9BRAD|nr:hypothetical protein SAMN05444169_6287 [Bradyrhizobium erythrophlei]